MANQLGKQKQPFNLWFPYWSNSQTPTPRPPPNQAPRSAPRSSPPAPVQPPRRPSRSPPPSSSSSPSPSPSPSPSRKSAPPKTTRQGPTPPHARSSQLSKSSPKESPRQTPQPRDSHPSPSPSLSEQTRTESLRKQPADESQSLSSQFAIQLQESQPATETLSQSLLPPEANVQSASAQGAQGVEMEKRLPEDVNPKTVAKPSDGDGPETTHLLEKKHEQVPEGPMPKQKEESTKVMEKNSTAELLQVTKDPEPHQPEKSASRVVMKTTRLLQEAAETVRGVRSSAKKETVNAPDGKEHNTMASSIPRSSSVQSFQKDLKEGMSKLVQKLSSGQSQPVNNEGAISIVTLAGENNGASMYIGYETSNKERINHLQNKEYVSDKGNATEGRSSEKKADQFSKRSDQTASAYPSPVSINSNVQSINNSILLGSSCRQEDPGIHLVFKGKTKRQFQKEDSVRSLQSTSRNAVSLTPVQEFTYDPNVRNIHLA